MHRLIFCVCLFVAVVTLFSSCDLLPRGQRPWVENPTLSNEQVAAWLKINRYEIERTDSKYVMRRNGTVVAVDPLKPSDELLSDIFIPTSGASTDYLVIKDVIVTRRGDGDLLVHIKGVGTGVFDPDASGNE